MIYVQIRDTKGNILAKPKTIKEAVELAEKLRDERKETMTIWDTTPVRKTANFYEYGYHAHIWVEYEPKFFMKINNDDWTKINVETENEFNNIVRIVKECNPDKTVETKIE